MTHWQNEACHLAVNQVRYSLLSREIETNGVLDTARELGVTIVAYTPIGTRRVQRKISQKPRAPEAACQVAQSQHAPRT